MLKPTPKRRAVHIRMDPKSVRQLDQLCKANGRSRRAVIEILVGEAIEELRIDPTARLNK